MRKSFLPIILLALLACANVAYAQLPQANLIYLEWGYTFNVNQCDTIFNFDPGQPVSSLNPYMNTIRLPDQAAGLAISPVLGSTDTTLTFYTTVNSTFWYYDHNTAAWVNTGHSNLDPSAVNLGAGGGHIYALRALGFAPSIYKYDGTGDATFLTTVQSPLPYDVIVDCSGNFYIMTLIGPVWSFTEYNSSGTIVQGYNVSNPSSWAGSGGMANIGHDLYTDLNGQNHLVHATVSGNNLTFDNATADIPFMQQGHLVGDMANVAGSLSDALPFISIASADTAICPGNTSSFTSNVTNAGTGGQYQWYVNSVAQFGATISTFSYQPSDGDTVSLHYTTSATCGSVTAISPGIVIHYALPTANINYGADQFCTSAGTIMPALTGASGGTYTASNGLSINSSTGAVNTITNTPGTYVITYTAGSGSCQAIARDTITINAVDIHVSAVTALPASTCTACDGKLVLHGLTPGQFDTVFYQKNGIAQPPATALVAPDSTITLANLCPGSYTNIKVKHTACASLPVTATITSPALQASFTYDIHYGCTTDTVLFSNTSVGQGNISGTWDFGDQSVDTASDPAHIYTTQNDYTVKLIVHTTGCTDSTTQSIDLVHPIAAGFTATPDTICQGRSVTFTNNSIGASPSFAWNFGDGLYDTSANPVHTFSKAGVFNVLLIEKDFVPCFDSASHIIVVDSVANMGFTVNGNPICQGQAAQFTCNCMTPGTRAFSWDFGDNSTATFGDPARHAYEHPGVYNITLTASYRACPDTSFSRSVTVNAYPVVNVGADTSMCPGSPAIRLVDTVNVGNPLVRWLWNTGDTTSSVWATQPGMYYATVSLNGCSNTDSIWVRNDCYIGIPNAFTPNGDGENDYFFPRQLLASSLASFSMSIYNRWGQLIFETKSTSGRGWDGRFNDVPQPSGVYIYVIDATFENGMNEHHNGNVTLLR